MRGEKPEMPMIVSGSPRFVRNDGSRLLMRVFHSSAARRVRISTSPDEKRPNSTAYGFGSTVTESIASSGSETCDRPVAGSTNAPGPSCTVDWLGRPPLMLIPPGTWITLASRRNADCTHPAGARGPAGGQPQRRLQAASGSDFVELAAVEILRRGERAAARHDRLRGD